MILHSTQSTNKLCYSNCPFYCAKPFRLKCTTKGGRVVSASDSETSVSSSTPTSAIIYDAYTSIIKKLKNTDNCYQPAKLSKITQSFTIQ